MANASQTAPSPGEQFSSFRAALIVVTALFFMWGFLTALNDILIPHLKAVFVLNYTQTMLIQFTFFSAYFVMSLPSGKIVSLFGYQPGIIIGLVTSAIGAFLFYPAASLHSYPLFLTALFVLASGITLLQVAANPYVAALGDPDTASSRLNLAQAFNSLGTTIAPYLGGILILSTSVLSAEQMAAMNPHDLAVYQQGEAESVQMPYIFLGLTLLVLAGVIAMFKLPRILDTEYDDTSEQHGTFKDVLKFSHLRLGVIGIFVYVGAEVAIGSFLVNYLAEDFIAGFTERQAAKYVSYYWGGAMIGRFIGSALMQRMNPGRLLGLAAGIAAALVATTILSSGFIAMWAVLAVGLFNSIMFPTIFTLGIRKLGNLTGRASSLLVMAIIGGAVVPLLQGGLADIIGIQYGFVLPFICYLYILWYGFVGSKTDPKVESANL